MQREILFRGLRKDGQEWVYGNLMISKTRGCYIKSQDDNKIFGSGIEVHPETVGQYTGLLDKNGVKVFEGDKINSLRGIEYTIVFIDENVQDIGDEIHAAFHASRINHTGNCISIPIDSYLKNNMEVIGNIHEGGNNG